MFDNDSILENSNKLSAQLSVNFIYIFLLIDDRYMVCPVIWWEWEGNGNNKVIPAHLYSSHCITSCELHTYGNSGSMVP